jgi:hypothetical protein
LKLNDVTQGSMPSPFAVLLLQPAATGARAKQQTAAHGANLFIIVILVSNLGGMGSRPK